MKSKKLPASALILFGLMLVGCNGNSFTAPASILTPTSSPFATKTLEVPTLIPTAMLMITSTPAMTQKPTETLVPTLEAKDLPHYGLDKFLVFYDTNGNCQLPCWWSISPGETTLDEVKLQFAPYGELITFEEYHDKVIIFYPAPSPSIDYNISSIVGFDETGTVTSISLDAETAMYNGFNPTYLLTKIGKPDQVQISSSQISMLYEKQNIFAVYDVSLDADKNQICFLNYDSLELWSSQVDSVSSPAKNQNDDENLQAFYAAFRTWKGSDNCFPFQ